MIAQWFMGSQKSETSLLRLEKNVVTKIFKSLLNLCFRDAPATVIMYANHNTANCIWFPWFLATFHLKKFFSRIFSKDNYSHSWTKFFKRMKISRKHIIFELEYLWNWQLLALAFIKDWCLNMYFSRIRGFLCKAS